MTSRSRSPSARTLAGRAARQLSTASSFTFGRAHPTRGIMLRNNRDAAGRLICHIAPPPTALSCVAAASNATPPRTHTLRLLARRPRTPSASRSTTRPFSRRLIGRPRHLAGCPRHLVARLRHLVARLRLLVGRPRHLVGRPRHLVGQPRHLVGRL